MSRLFRRKPLDALIAEGGEGEHSLKKALTAVDLIALGIGAIIGAGIFATLGSATSGGTGQPPAGPGVAVSILLTAIVCGFCALCYAEFASLVPVCGSAYTYSYATLGELVAWIIGWDVLAASITAAITWLLVRGVKESARFNNVIVVLKVLTLLFFIAVGTFFVKPENWHPFFPGGFHGVWTGASLIFFAYIGFDAISTAAEECVDPGRDMPRGIIGSLVICTVLYIAAALVLTGMIPYGKLVGVADPLAAALAYVHQDWAAGFLAAGAVI